MWQLPGQGKVRRSQQEEVCLRQEEQAAKTTHDGLHQAIFKVEVANQIVKERQQRKVESYKNDPKAALSSSKIPFKDYHLSVIATPPFKSFYLP